MRCEALRPAEIEERIRIFPVAYVALGTIEWHGHHLPLGTDGLKVQKLCVRVARCAGGVVMPTVYFAAGGVPFPWTMNFPINTVEELLVHLFGNLAKFGFKVIVALSGHYSMDHYLAVKRSSLEAMRRGETCIYAAPEIELTFDHGYRGEHAAKWETSLMCSLQPDMVDVNQLDSHSDPLLGISGKDPRTHASRLAGDEIANIIVTRLSQVASRLLKSDIGESRPRYLDALSKQVELLRIRFEKYRGQAWESCPPLMIPEYVEFLDHFWQGEYGAADEVAAALMASVGAD